MANRTEPTWSQQRPNRRVDAYLIRYFIAVAEHRSITRAADALFLGQPSLSQAIQSLERRLGVTLFDRSVQPLRLTSAGERFLPAARALLTDIEAAKTAVQAVRDLRYGRLDIASHAAFSVDPLVPLIQRFTRAHQDILVNILAAETSEEARELVRNGRAELAIGYGDSEHTGLETVSLPPQEIVLTAVPRLLESQPTPLPRASVTEFPFILGAGDRATTAMLRHLSGTGDTPRVVANCANPTALWGLVSRGVGAALLSRRVAEDCVPNTVAVSLDPPLYRTPGLCTRTEPLSTAAAAFVELAVVSPSSK
jgi:DNA-binding transcriptional LysR family regulator